jgi:benzil reductase ((S)-benzoin forming)
MKHVIITGASRGFGASIAINISKKDVVLHLVARSDMSELAANIQDEASDVYTYEFDLSKTDMISQLHKKIFNNITLNDAESIVLINNAGLLKPIGPVGKYPVDEYRTNVEVNYVAPVLLTQLFVNETENFKGDKKVIMISSGAANKAYYGWSHYCSTKAGLNRYMEVLSLEQKDLEFPVRTMAFNPGMMETNMQKEIRSQTKEDFLFVEKFLNAKEHGLVGDPDVVSMKMINLLWTDRFPDGEVINAADL